MRRRRLGALGVVAALAAIMGMIAGAGGDDDGPAPAAATVPAQCGGSDPAAVKSLAGQRLIVRSDAEPDAKLLARAKRGEIAGVVVFPATGQDEEDAKSGMAELQRAAERGGQPPLLTTTDQEGGIVKRFVAGPPQRAPAQLALDGDGDDAQLEGKATGSFLQGIGINTDLAPVLDVPSTSASVIAGRAFGDDDAEVSNLGLRFAAGLAKAGALATAKHFPGLGRSTTNTDFAPSSIDASRRELQDDLLPFQRAISQGVPLVMIGIASYPALGSKQPAALSPEIAQGLLRDRMGFEGVSISDDLQAGAIEATLTAPRAGIAAAAAGTDLLLYAGDAAPGVLEPLAKAISAGRIDVESARESCVRVVELRESLAAAD